MTFTTYYDYSPGISTPIGSRSVAMVYPGAICPMKCSFGRVHGTAAARGSVTFKGVVLLPIAQIVILQIGEAVFYGRAIKGEIEFSTNHGNNTTFSLVDMRDKLHDLNIFAQYNMMNDTGQWWHILAENWQEQTPSYIHALQDISDFQVEQELPGELELKEAQPPFSVMTLMKYWATTYGFTFSWAFSAGEKMKRHHHENLDFNGGIKLADAIETVLSRSNLQFTAWGDLHLHITERGVPDSAFEIMILSGNVNLCNLIGQVDASLGSELNERGRRVVIVGGRDLYENWYPCMPDWESVWTQELCDDTGYQLATLLKGLGLTQLNKLQDMPANYWDLQKYDGKPRLDMTIKDYIENIPFKMYRVDTRKQLHIAGANALDVPALLHPDGQLEDFVDREYLRDDRIFQFGRYSDRWKLDSLYPISGGLVSDPARQFIAVAMTRNFYAQGMRTKQQFLEGQKAYVTDGASLEVEEYIDEGVVSLIGGPEHDRELPDGTTINTTGRKLYALKLKFSERKIKGKIIVENAGETGASEKYEWTPDVPYVKIALEKNLFTYVAGEGRGNPRVREIVKSMTDLKRFFINNEEVAMLSQSILDEGWTNDVYAEDIAIVIAQRVLFHEYVSSSGHITFRKNAGFLPNGVIDNVNITFDPKSGLREVVNFTNAYNDDRNIQFFPAVRRKVIKTDKDLEREALQAQAKKLAGQAANQVGGGMVMAKEGEGNPKIAKIAGALGRDGDAVVKVNLADLEVPVLGDGEIFMVKES